MQSQFAVQAITTQVEPVIRAGVSRLQPVK